jgi:S-adenosylmethionine:tRNA ribosyltransferase-isomerase
MSTDSVQPNLKTDYYDFDLPKELIAQEPLANREDARLLQVERDSNTIDHHHIRDLDSLLRPGDCLVLNDTKVIPAKLVGYREQTRGRWQGLFLEADAQGNWRLLAKTRGRIKAGEKVVLQDRNGVDRVRLVLLSKMEGGQWIARPEDEADTMDTLSLVGRIPLPHYIRGGNMVDADIQNYQTVFAQQPGAVAAPTAGLHLTKPLINRLIDREINLATVTLHVGIGTFRPVGVDNLTDHEMHFEFGSINEKSTERILEAKRAGGRVIAVGTTSVRVLETAGADGELKPWSGDTNLFIRPGYDFRVIDGLLTNFHLPRSTLLVLVRTFGGDKLIQEAYQAAVEEEYRFFSYGDAMLIV